MKTTSDALRAALDWIDAVPQDTPLPAMPGFDRGAVEDILARGDTLEALMKDHHPLITVDTPNQITRDMLALGAPVTIPDAAIACGYPSLTEALENDATRAVVFAVMALMRYEYADAMLKAREGV